MKRNLLALLATGLVVAMSLAGCGASPEDTSQETVQAATAASDSSLVEQFLKSHNLANINYQKGEGFSTDTGEKIDVPAAVENAFLSNNDGNLGAALAEARAAVEGALPAAGGVESPASCGWSEWCGTVGSQNPGWGCQITSSYNEEVFSNGCGRAYTCSCALPHGAYGDRIVYNDESYRNNLQVNAASSIYNSDGNWHCACAAQFGVSRGNTGMAYGQVRGLTACDQNLVVAHSTSCRID